MVKRRATVQEILERVGVDPFVVMAEIAAGKTEYPIGNQVNKDTGAVTSIMGLPTPELRLRASAELAKYIYPQLRATELSTPPGETLKIEVLTR